jgi:hypothetical protein
VGTPCYKKFIINFLELENVFNEMDNINWKTLNYDEFLALIPNERVAYQFCLSSGLVDRETKCECGETMNLKIDNQKKVGKHFVCSSPKSQCRKTKSALVDSFFYRARIDICMSLKCIASYASNFSTHQMAFYCSVVSRSTVTNWRSHFRKICGEYIQNHINHKIGGIGTTVEIDESQIFKRKNHVGRLLTNEDQGIWVVGGICRETRDAFILDVRSRDSRTLKNAIIQHVEIGSRIISDGWRGYSWLVEDSWNHQQVNHSENFVHPQDPDIHTQTIERMWKTLKRTIPKECNSQLRWEYLNEFLFKQRTGWYSLKIGERIQIILNTLKTIRYI